MNKKTLLLLSIGGIMIFSTFFLLRQADIEDATLGKRFEKDFREQEKKTEILFVGDIMLDRGVEYYSEQADDVSYPFQKIKSFLTEGDVVVCNLEGTIVQDPPYFGPHSYNFAFKKETAAALSSANVNLASLANNHTHDMGKEGIKETKQILEENNIGFLGDPVVCDHELSFKKNDIVFFAVNKTFPFNCSDGEVASQVRDLRRMHPQKMLITIFHWGHEYHDVNSPFQEKLARLAIDSGSDLVVGHHPHVVQNIEQYKDKLIFYSLGNFIFDQDFSKETKQGLTVKMTTGPKNLVFNLSPVNIEKGQPSLMPSGQKQEFLSKLAERSNPELMESIKEGIISVKR